MRRLSSIGTQEDKKMRRHLKWVVKVVVLFLIVVSGLGSVAFLTRALDERDTFALICSLFLFVTMMMLSQLLDTINKPTGGPGK